ncbi:methyltransferase [Paractinoplanes ferrugineus]|uniref:O-methyltransferase n=1 Tax=Paractinoplanes ferrugineus TaxID=113564 RepID=A0A919J382_9ACTN|nr:methyltransferase [Actinoplanes ferrugineus]GIE13705.1 O-methyltransferase [Actinoplanes ferrugineus]
MSETGDSGGFAPIQALGRLAPYHWSAGLVMRGLAELRIADQLAGGPRTAVQVAAAIGAHAPSLHRFLRVCVLHDLVTAEEGGRFALTDRGALLRSDVPSLRGFTIAVNAPGMTRPWEQIADVVRTGRPASEQVLGTSHWDHYAKHPAEARAYVETSATLSAEAADALVRTIDCTGVRRVVDVGGSPGTVLAAVLDAAPQAHGVLLDLDWAVPYAEAELARRGLAGRTETVGGDFRVAVPPGGDLYLLKNILCDLDDDTAATVLSVCAAAAPAGGRLVVVDWEDTGDTSHVHANDVEFMVLTGGRVRTGDEYEELLRAAGFEQVRRTRLSGFDRAPIVVLEGRRGTHD